MIREINQDEFKEATKEGFTLVDVYGEYCGPCKSLAKTLEILDKQFPFMNIVKIESGANKEFAKEHKIFGVPTILFMYDGEIKQTRMGALGEKEIMEIAGEYLY